MHQKGYHLADASVLHAPLGAKWIRMEQVLVNGIYLKAQYALIALG